MGARQKGRELAIQMLYQWDVTREPLDAILASIGALRSSGASARGFADALVSGTLGHIEAVDRAIESRSANWRMDRIGAVERSILRVAVYELLETDTPRQVVINEALELTKKFSQPDAVSFVNGVLDAVVKSLEATPGSR